MQPYKRPKSAAWTFLTGIESNPGAEAKLARLPSDRKYRVAIEVRRNGKTVSGDTITVQRRR